MSSVAIPAALRVLIVDDVEDDALLAEAALRQGGYDVTARRVDSAAALEAALRDERWDVILCDYRMPRFSGLEAVAQVRGHGLDLPFILVSGTIGEETAVAALQAGADDYVMKGNPVRLVPSVQRTLREVAERRQLQRRETALRASEERYRSLVETSPDAIALTDVRGIVLIANQQSAALYHYPDPETLIGLHALDLVVPADRERAAAAMGAIGKGAVLDTHTYTALRHDGTTFTIELRSTLIHADDEAPDSIMIVARDVTARNEKEERLRFQSQLLDTAGQATIATDVRGVITYWNHAAETLYGWTSEAVQGQHILAILPTEPFRAQDAVTLQTVIDGGLSSGEYLVRDRSGRTFPIMATAVPVHDHGGNTVGVVGVSTEISARVRAEETLRQSEQRFRVLFEHAPIGMALLDMSGRIVLVNAVLLGILGYDQDTLCSMTFAEITHPDDVAADWALYHEMLDGTRDSYSMDKRYIHKDGRLVWGHLAVSITRDEHGAPQSIIGMMLDITERHEAELARELARTTAEELAQYRQERADEASAMDTVSAALASTLDSAHLYQVILEQAARMLPCDHASVTLYERGQATYVATWGEPRLQPGLTSPMNELWLPDMRTSSSYQPDSDLDPSWNALPPLVGPFRERSILSTPLTIEGTLVGSFDVSSRIPNIYAERHRRLIELFAIRATEALHNARLYEAEQVRRRAAEDLVRLRSDFVSAVSHELRTPLTAIVGFGELLLARWDQFSDERRLQRIAQIVQAANRQKRMVEDLLLLSQVEASKLALKLEPTRIVTLIRQATAEVQATYEGQPIEVQGSSRLRISVDSVRALQILVNLLDNAAKYSDDGSIVSVSWKKYGTMAVIRIRDHGPGLPVAGRDQLFTRFGRMPGSRTRAGHVGTGLGLFLARQLAETMGGDLELEMTGPQGSTFRLRLLAAS